VEAASVAAPTPAEAQAPSGLYAYSQAAVQGAVAVAVAEPVPQAEVSVEPAEPKADDSFIAPPPVEPEPAPEPALQAPARQAAAPQAKADPFATAAMENGSRAPRGGDQPAAMGRERKKAPGLFAKMTGGAARALQAATQGGEQRNPAAVRTPGAQPAARTSAEPPAAAEPSLRAPSGPADQDPARPAAQPRLSGLDPAGRGSRAQLDEDLLDIPAFLRRQAN
jgi:cell division protein FtsZ